MNKKIIMIIMSLVVVIGVLVGITLFLLNNRVDDDISSTETDFVSESIEEDYSEAEVENSVDENNDEAVENGVDELVEAVNSMRNSATIMGTPWREYIGQYAPNWCDGNNDFAYESWQEFENQTGNVEYKSYIKDSTSGVSLHLDVKNVSDGKTRIEYTCGQYDGCEALISQGFNLYYNSEIMELEGLAPWIIENNIKSAQDIIRVLGLNDLAPELELAAQQRQLARTNIGDFYFVCEPTHDIRDDIDGDTFVIQYLNEEASEFETIKFELYDTWFVYSYNVINEKYKNFY